MNSSNPLKRTSLKLYDDEDEEIDSKKKIDIFKDPLIKSTEQTYMSNNESSIEQSTSETNPLLNSIKSETTSNNLDRKVGTNSGSQLPIVFTFKPFY